jgi:NitT/TauT family transport system substrate-binding protein
MNLDAISTARALFCLRSLVIATVMLAASSTFASDRIRIVAQKTGTFAWELEVIRAHGLDRKADLAIETAELASTEAGQIALKGGSADLILSAWLWVARERALGDDLVFYPYSSALGAVMVPKDSPIRTIGDLRSRKLGVAGGPLDKSWLLLQALARRSGIDLKTQADIAYGAPPLLSAMALQGKMDATLTFWNSCVGLEAKGMRRAITIADVMTKLGASRPVAMVGYVFHSAWAERNRALLARFFAAASEAEKILSDSPAEWQRLAPRIGVSGNAALEIYRQRYIEGIPRRPLADEIADAKVLYRFLSDTGGADVVGRTHELAPGTFYGAGSSE